MPAIGARSLPTNKDYLKDILKDFQQPNKEMRRCYVEHMEGRRHIYLKNLFVLPSHQHRGLGITLLQWGLDHAGSEQIPNFLSATDRGHGMYKRAGMVSVGKWEIDLEEWARKIEVKESQLGMWQKQEEIMKSQGDHLEGTLKGEVDIEFCVLRQPTHQIKTGA
ncbi:putative gnat family [Phaeomoniella chlamydospora]|uniref:Putative gnat family n=1 Tax=Phaeomoniella chlamydospora TaxID=158046 RepID=A0A0G2GVW5_PHACM|nr:putative gnat family [Phaeomoniella chlamydospora]